MTSPVTRKMVVDAAVNPAGHGKPFLNLERGSEQAEFAGYDFSHNPP